MQPENHANRFAWMPGALLTDGNHNTFESSGDVKLRAIFSYGYRRREAQRIANCVRRVDNVIRKMMRQEVI